MPAAAAQIAALEQLMLLSTCVTGAHHVSPAPAVDGCRADGYLTSCTGTRERYGGKEHGVENLVAKTKLEVVCFR